MLDDFGLMPMADITQRDLLEIIDDHYAKKSTVIASQVPVEPWHAYLGDAALADDTFDRLVRNNQRRTLAGESMRKCAAAKIAATNTVSA